MNGKRAFTLVELLVVVAIIAMLLGMLMPQLSSIRAIGRAAVCKTHLKQIGQGFADARGHDGGGAQARPFPAPDSWPAIPMDVLPDEEMYLCPENPHDGTGVCLEAYSIHYGENCQELEGFNLLIAPTSDGYGHGGSPICKVRDMGSWTLYIFDDGACRDLDDWAFRVTKSVPRIATRIQNPENPDSTPSGYRTCSIWVNGQELDGWGDLRDVNLIGKSFTMDGEGVLDYGFNAAVDCYEVAPETIVALDYDMRVANRGEDMTDVLGGSARHRGKLNYLRADGGVLDATPSQLDPAFTGNADQWTP